MSLLPILFCIPPLLTVTKINVHLVDFFNQKHQNEENIKCLNTNKETVLLELENILFSLENSNLPDFNYNNYNKSKELILKCMDEYPNIGFHDYYFHSSQIYLFLALFIDCVTNTYKLNNNNIPIPLHLIENPLLTFVKDNYNNTFFINLNEAVYLKDLKKSPVFWLINNNFNEEEFIVDLTHLNRYYIPTNQSSCIGNVFSREIIQKYTHVDLNFENPDLTNINNLNRLNRSDHCFNKYKYTNNFFLVVLAATAAISLNVFDAVYN